MDEWPAAEASGAPPRSGVLAGRRAPFIWLVLGAAIVLWLARDVLAPFILAAVLAYAFSPLVGRAADRTGWPRIVVVGIAYVFVVALLIFIAILFAGRIANEITLLAASGPDSLAALLKELVGKDSIQIGGQEIAVADIAREIQARVGNLLASPGDAAQAAGTVGGVLLETILALIVTFYFLVDGPTLWRHTTETVPFDRREQALALLARIHDVLGKWLRGQLALIALVTVVIYVALGPILHLPYALGIAIVSGFLEIIPLVGPLIATAIAAIDAFAHGGVGLAVVVIVIYFVVRQVEDQVVMPQVIGRVVHLHPVVTIFAVLVGLQVYGILGGLLGVPVAAAVNVVYREFYGRPETLVRPASGTDGRDGSGGQPLADAPSTVAGPPSEDQGPARADRM